MKKILFLLTLLFAAQLHAHGGDDHKDHAHAAPSTVLETASAVPTLRAESEQFELVARLYADELGAAALPRIDHHFIGRSAGDPAAPGEADDHRRDDTAEA